MNPSEFLDRFSENGGVRLDAVTPSPRVGGQRASLKRPKKCVADICKWLLPVLAIIGVAVLIILIVALVNKGKKQKLLDVGNHVSAAGVASVQRPHPSEMPPFPVPPTASAPGAASTPRWDCMRPSDQQQQPQQRVPQAFPMSGFGSRRAFAEFSGNQNTIPGMSNDVQYSDNRLEPYTNNRAPQPQQPPQKSFASSHAQGAVEVDAAQLKDALFNRKQSAVVMIHANWCGPCQATKPMFKQAATMARLPFYMLEQGKADEAFMKALRVEGFPTILKFEQGERIAEYSGDRSAEDLARFGSQ